MSVLVSSISNWFTRHLENPSSSLSDPDEWVIDAFGGERTDTGIRVNRRIALGYAAVKRAVDMISRDIAKLPLNVFRRIGEKGREKDKAHAAYNLLRWKPNSEMIAFKWVQVVMNHALIEGNSYTFVVRDGAGRPLELLPLNPDVTVPMRQDGRLFYVTKLDDDDVALLPEDVIHVIGISFDGRIGIRLIDLAKNSFGHGIAMERYGSRFFANSARPNLALVVDGTISEAAAQRLRRSFDKIYSGLDNAHRTAILEAGTELKTFSINAKDSQLIDSQNFNVKQVANWFNLPPHKLGDEAKTSFSSLEQENQAYLNEALDPWMFQIEQLLRDLLLTESEKRNDSHFVEFNRNALVRVDMKTRGEFYRTTVGVPIFSPDEARAFEGMNPLPDGEGKKVAKPLNMGGETVPEPDRNSRTETEEGSRESKDEMVGAMVREYTERCLGRLQVHAERATKEPRKFLAWIDGIKETNNEKLEAIYPDGLRMAGIDCPLEGILERVAEAMLTAAECQPSELPGQVRKAFEELRGDNRGTPIPEDDR